MNIESSQLFQRMAESLGELPDLGWILPEFSQLRELVSAQASYIKVLFPEYTPHDETFHFSHLFDVADKVLGHDLYNKLNPVELALLSFALCSHD